MQNGKAIKVKEKFSLRNNRPLPFMLYYTIFTNTTYDNDPELGKKIICSRLLELNIRVNGLLIEPAQITYDKMKELYDKHVNAKNLYSQMIKEINDEMEQTVKTAYGATTEFVYVTDKPEYKQPYSIYKIVLDQDLEKKDGKLATQTCQYENKNVDCYFQKDESVATTNPLHSETNAGNTQPGVPKGGSRRRSKRVSRKRRSKSRKSIRKRRRRTSKSY
jgi:hypothetical protein